MQEVRRMIEEGDSQMRRMLLVFLIFIFAFTALSCEKIHEEPESAITVNTVEDGILYIAVVPDNKPFCYYNEDLQLTGIDIDLAQMVADHLDLQLEIRKLSVPLDGVDAFSNFISRKNSDCYTGIFDQNNTDDVYNTQSYAELNGKKYVFYTLEKSLCDIIRQLLNDYKQDGTMRKIYTKHGFTNS